MNFKYGKLMTIIQFACVVNMLFKIDPLIAKFIKRKLFMFLQIEMTQDHRDALLNLG
jgi:hypothetical protein